MNEEQQARKRASRTGWVMILIVALAAIALESLLRGALPAGKGYPMLIGTYTGSGSAGVYTANFNAARGTIVLLDSAAAGNPSFVVPAGDFAYSVNEHNDGTQGVTAYSLSPTGGISVINSRPLGTGFGEDPCNVLLAGGQMITSNYTGGDLAAFPIAPDGSLEPMSTLLRFGPEAHLHCARLSPDGKYIFAVDLGNSRVYRFDTALRDSTVAFQGSDGLGPRHLIFDRSGSHAYLLSELTDSLVCFDYSDGSLTKKQTLLAYDGGGKGGADVHLSPDGRYLYTSHRLKGDGIGIFAVRKDGTVEPAGFLPTGSHPRNFALSPDGKWLLVACRDADAIEVYRLKKGLPGGKAFSLGMSKPVCISWY